MVHQAIQDGFSGVYRRAIRVYDPEHDVLAVHVRKNSKVSNDAGTEKETVLYFPLSQHLQKKPS